MDDPYRSSRQVGVCPRCSNSAKDDGELGRLVCPAGCGEFYPRATLEQLLAWTEVEAQPGGVGVDGQRARATNWPWGAALCPICRNEMKVGHRNDVRYDYCRPHGVWLDSGEIARFADVFKLK